MIEIVGVDIGLNETTCSFLQSESNRPPIQWIEASQWKINSPIRTISEATRRIHVISEWYAHELTSRGIAGHNENWKGERCIVGVETYIYQGEERAKNKWGPYVARLAGIIEGISWCLSDHCYGISRNEAIRSVTTAALGKRADYMIHKLTNMPEDTDQHTRAASLVGFAALQRFRSVSVPALSSASGSPGTSRARTGAGRSQSAPSSKASSRAKRRTRS